MSHRRAELHTGAQSSALGSRSPKTPEATPPYTSRRSAYTPGEPRFPCDSLQNPERSFADRIPSFTNRIPSFANRIPSFADRNRATGRRHTPRYSVCSAGCGGRLIEEPENGLHPSRIADVI